MQNATILSFANYCLSQKFKRIALAVFVSAVSISAYSQIEQQKTNEQKDAKKELFERYAVVPPSAEAADLGKFGNAQTSLFIGQPDVSIPIL